MSIRPAESVNRAAEQMRRTPAAAAGREEGACEGAGEDEERAEGGEDCAVPGAGRSLRGVRLPEGAAEAEEGGAAEEMEGTDEACRAESPSPVSPPHAVAVASTPISSADNSGGRSERGRDVVVCRGAGPFR
ncbi:hypothetical protein [Streptomyces hygroscopicus]|uniref:hypothetical protein n=1 Tax=Streptomyces hygroscopicus TaxID=1912 RepID=UPI0036CC49FB